MERLRPLAQRLRTACGSLDVPVVEALCISDGRFWSYCCPEHGCCPAEGRADGRCRAPPCWPRPPPTPASRCAAPCARCGPGSLPWETAAALAAGSRARHRGQSALVPRILDDGEPRGRGRGDPGAGTRDHRAPARTAPTLSGTLHADLRDDELLGTRRSGRPDPRPPGPGDPRPRRRMDGRRRSRPGAAAVARPGPPLRRPLRRARRGAAHPRRLGRLVHRRRTGGPGSPGHGPRAPTPTTSSPACSTRPATKASTPSRSAAACARSAGDATWRRPLRAPGQTAK